MIERIKKILIALPLTALAILPPIRMDIPIFINSDLWLWTIMLAGLLGFLFLYSNASVSLKLLVAYLFLNCFTSKVPYLSFTSYIIFITVAYYYLLCLQLKDFDFMKKVIQAIFFLDIVLIVNQRFGGDTLLNFGRNIPVCFGSIGNQMTMASFLICLAPFLLLSSRLNIIPLIIICFLSRSSGMALSLCAGVLVYGFMRWRDKKTFWIMSVIIILATMIFAYTDGVLWKVKIDRFPIWQRTIQLANQNPLMGWGIGTYKVLMPVFSRDIAGGQTAPWEYEGTKGIWIAWRQAHNDWLQSLFEIGRIGIILFLAFLTRLLIKVIRSNAREKNIALAGFFMVATNMLVHFPTRTIQSLLLIICFLAYCNHLTKEVVI